MKKKKKWRNNMECDKYKFKALIGLIILSFFIWEKIFNFVDVDSLLVIVITGLIIFIIGMTLIRDYLECLTDYNRRHKPPFQK